MLGCGRVSHPGGMMTGGSRLEGILRVRVNGLHSGVCLLKTASSSQKYRALLADLELDVMYGEKRASHARYDSRESRTTRQGGCRGCVDITAYMELVLFVSHLRPMGLNVLGYQSHLLQRCHPACGY